MKNLQTDVWSGAADKYTDNDNWSGMSQAAQRREKAALGNRRAEARQWANVERPFACSTPRCDVGEGSFWVGRLVLPSHLSSWSLVVQMLSTSPLVGCAMPSGDRCPLPALIFNLASAVPGLWRSQCADICSSLDVALPRSFGVCSGSSPGSVHSWFRACVSPRLDQSLRQRLCTAASALAVSHVDLRLLSVNQGPDHVVHGRSTLPSHARLCKENTS